MDNGRFQLGGAGGGEREEDDDNVDVDEKREQERDPGIERDERSKLGEKERGNRETSGEEVGENDRRLCRETLDP